MKALCHVIVLFSLGQITYSLSLQETNSGNNSDFRQYSDLETESSKAFPSGKELGLLGKPGCEGPMEMKKMSGIISSPNYPQPYGSNYSCLWLIKTPKDHVIHLSFQDFDLEQGQRKIPDNKPKCAFDYLYIFESYLTIDKGIRHADIVYLRKRRTWGKFCGYQVPDPPITSHRASLMYIYFHSDSSREFRGFHLTYHMIKLIEKDTLIPRNAMNSDSGRLVIGGESKAEKELKVFAFGFATLLFCIIGFAAVIRLFQSTTRSENRSIFRSAWTFTRNGQRISPSEMQLQEPPRLPTPPPQYRDVVKSDEDWSRVSEQLGESSAIALRRQFEAEELEVTYDSLESELPEPGNCIPQPSSNQQASCVPSSISDDGSTE